MADKLRNCFLINAPARSGKTTQIKAMVQKCLADNPQDNILCITYTNRAAEELSKNLNAKNVFIGTIHSFLHNFMKRYFSHSDILNLYFEVCGERIQQRIANSEKDEHIEVSNKKYEEKYGVIDFDTVKKNIAAISYNESPFSSLLELRMDMKNYTGDYAALLKPTNRHLENSDHYLKKKERKKDNVLLNADRFR